MVLKIETVLQAFGLSLKSTFVFAQVPLNTSDFLYVANEVSSSQLLMVKNMFLLSLSLTNSRYVQPLNEDILFLLSLKIFKKESVFSILKVILTILVIIGRYFKKITALKKSNAVYII
jgi:hypothetical protein